MATVRVSFLLAGERLHRRLNRSVLSDVPAPATRVNRAGPDHKVIRLRGLSHARQYGTDQAVFLRRERTRAVIFPSPSARARPGGERHLIAWSGWLPPRPLPVGSGAAACERPIAAGNPAIHLRQNAGHDRETIGGAGNVKRRPRSVRKRKSANPNSN